MVTKLTIEYDGGGLRRLGAANPARGPCRRKLERGLQTILGDSGTDGAPLRLTVAGRTDRGVHAWGQVASLLPRGGRSAAAHGLLDDDLAVLAAEPAAEGFDARRDARSRTYCYRVLARRTRGVFQRGNRLLVDRPLRRRGPCNACAAALLGKHDFSAFTPRETEHSWFRCDVSRAEWLIEGDLLEFWIEADMFLRHMNRVLVGTMLDIAEGQRPLEDFAQLLQGGQRSEAGRTAPAHGLALASVSYAP